MLESARAPVQLIAPNARSAFALSREGEVRIALNAEHSFL